jgi:3-mercaptopyruvate sulfurtransferase SseA
MNKKIIGLMIGIGSSAAVIGCNLNISQPTQDAPKAPAFPTEDPYYEVPRVSLEDAKAAFDNLEAVFVDVRGTAAFQAGHISSALSIPGTELTSRLSELDPKQWIITYCT